MDRIKDKKTVVPVQSGTQNPLHQVEKYDRCFVCGQENPLGLRLIFSFSNEIAGTSFTPPKSYEGYPGVLHGGFTSMLLDEAMAKACLFRGLKAVTARMQTQFRKPIPSGSKISIEGWISSRNGRRVNTQAKIISADNTILAEAEATFIVLEEHHAQPAQ